MTFALIPWVLAARGWLDATLHVCILTGEGMIQILRKVAMNKSFKFKDLLDKHLLYSGL